MKHCFRYIILLLFIYSIYASCKKETSCENCRTNKPPIAHAGADQSITLPTDSVLLDGRSSSDPDGVIISYLWTKISGPSSFNINRSADSLTKVKKLTEGVYLFELKVTDNGGLSAKDTVQITVNKANHPPVANAGPDQTITLPTNTILLDGSGSSDPDNNIVSYAWTKISGPSSPAIVNPNTAKTQVTSLTEGVYQFELKVTDAGGLFSKDTVRVFVNSSVPPTVYTGADIIITLPLDSVYLEASTTSMSPVSFQWTEISGPSVVAIANAGSYSTLGFVKGLIPGLYTFRVEIGSRLGSTADTITVLVIDNPQDPNTITFRNLKWRVVDEYGLGILDLDIAAPAQPNLFIAWDQIRPAQIYLQLDPASTMFVVPSTQAGATYGSDWASPYIWIVRLPRDDTWVGKSSSIKIKLF